MHVLVLWVSLHRTGPQPDPQLYWGKLGRLCPSSPKFSPSYEIIDALPFHGLFSLHVSKHVPLSGQVCLCFLALVFMVPSALMAVLFPHCIHFSAQSYPIQKAFLYYSNKSSSPLLPSTTLHILMWQNIICLFSLPPLPREKLCTYQHSPSTWKSAWNVVGLQMCLLNKRMALISYKD